MAMRGARRPSPRSSAADRPARVAEPSGRRPTMMPVSSISGMNLFGGTSPSSGLCQRTSASTPMRRPVRVSIFGW